MKFDMVFDVQKAFRKVLKAFSYPGDILSLEEEAESLDTHWSCYPATKLLMFMLLDADTTFAIDTVDEKLSIQFRKMTYSVEKTLSQATYVFVTRQHPTSLAELMEQANVGTLEDPHMSATMIIECDSLEEGEELKLQGPGILNEKRRSVQIDQEWITSRNEKNHEFPLGIDLLFVDKAGNMMALPRTTKIERSTTWHM